MIEVKIDNRAVLDALQRLQEATGNLSPALRAIGKDMVLRTKQRFESGTAPDGARWKANAQSTIEAFVSTKGGIGKSGKINARGQAAAMSKRPLHGHSGDLERQLHYAVSGDSLTVGVSPIYAAIQQFGGQAGRGKQATIPARPFLPLTANQELDPREADLVLAEINKHLQRALPS